MRTSASPCPSQGSLTTGHTRRLSTTCLTASYKSVFDGSNVELPNGVFWLDREAHRHDVVYGQARSKRSHVDVWLDLEGTVGCTCRPRMESSANHLNEVVWCRILSCSDRRGVARGSCCPTRSLASRCRRLAPPRQPL